MGYLAHLHDFLFNFFLTQGLVASPLILEDKTLHGQKF